MYTDALNFQHVSFQYFKIEGDAWIYNNLLEKGDYRGSL